MSAIQALVDLHALGIPLSALLLLVLTLPDSDMAGLDSQSKAAVRAHLGSLATDLRAISNGLHSNDRTSLAMRDCSRDATLSQLLDQIRMLSSVKSGWHFAALHAKVEQMETFKIDVMAAEMRMKAPEVWFFVRSLVCGGRDQDGGRRDQDGDVTMARAPMDGTGDDDEIEMWMSIDQLYTDASPLASPFQADTEPPISDSDPSSPPKSKRTFNIAEHRRALADIVNLFVLALIISILCEAFQRAVMSLSMMMYGTNQKCNALPSTIGIFMHSCNTPTKVIESFAHAGLSISNASINSAITSMSHQCEAALKNVGQTLVTSYAYDNFDIDLKTAQPTTENPESTLVHLTSGTLIPLQHNVTKEDLEISAELWKTSQWNPKLPEEERLARPKPNIYQFLGIHPEPEHPSSKLTRRQREFARKFREDLVFHGPEYFHQYRQNIGEPERVEMIPLQKTKQYPARAMDVKNSTIDGNIRAVSNLLQQGGVGDPNDEADSRWESDSVDISQHVVLIHGDLATIERLQGILKQRSLEKTPFRRFQFAIPVMGLFHLKMAAADAIWRIFIEPPKARSDEHCLMQHVGVIRPTETGKIGSKKVGFRRMHEVIKHVGVVIRLSCWIDELSKRLNLSAEQHRFALDHWAANDPTWDEVVALSEFLAKNYVASANQVRDARKQKDKDRDQQRENMLLLQHYFLLYEELSRAMNDGDIGRVETCFIPWMQLFKAIGKHKYAKAIKQYLTNLHFVYPPSLR